MNFPVMRGTKAGHVLDRIGFAVRERDDVVDFELSDAIRRLKDWMFATAYFAPMIGSFFANCDHEWVAIIGTRPKRPH
jgi:hypothetical protein